MVEGPRVALLHDWLTGQRGGERVLESFCELYPPAPLYTLIHVPHSVSPLIESRKIVTSFLNRIPGIGTNYRKFLPLMPRAAESLRIEPETEVVLSSSSCVIKGVPKPLRAVHLSYIHSPMRYMYDQFDLYFGKQASLPIRLGARFFRRSITEWDLASNRNVDLMIANSTFVRERIRRFYQRDAEVIHAFVDFSEFEFLPLSPRKEEYFIVVSAFAPNKRVDLAIEAFNELKLPLRIIGSGQQERLLRAMAGPTVSFLGNLPRRQLIQQLAGARALVFPGVEDFGITPLEALRAGTPVIAYKAGGVLDSLTEEDTLFFHEPTTPSLTAAVRNFSRFSPRIDRERLKQFSKERFQEKIKSLVEYARVQFKP
ncbi:MAG: glycosyltransferase family 4 protein [Bdellovibrio sp.]|nr:MAG: glycosyltransferase family 4 protein [Bdellovibrio sp.]